MKSWITCIRREYWESRSLWIGPLAVAAFVLVSTIIAAVRMETVLPGMRGQRRFGPQDLETGDALGITVLVTAAPIMAIGTLAIFGYVLECLYGERRDRSILFWKSLPVSDAQTVLSKLAVALVVTPLIIFGLSLVTHLACSAVIGIGVMRGRDMPELWTFGQWLRSYASFAGLVGINMLWFAPVVVYGMLASVVARRIPLLFAVVPLVVVTLGEKLTFDTSHSLRFVLNRLRPRFSLDHLGAPELWIGVVASAAVIVVIIRLRRWRDDS